jgi:hypothetical protein
MTKGSEVDPGNDPDLENERREALQGGKADKTLGFRQV